MEIVNKNDQQLQLGNSNDIKLKNYLVRLGKESSCGGQFQMDFDWALCKAKNLFYAEAQALESHCSQAFDCAEDVNGTWIKVGGHWTYDFTNGEYQDECRQYWIESIEELPEANALILQNYLRSF